MKGQYFSRAVEKALLALDCIRRSSAAAVTGGDLRRLLGLTKASAFRLLYTLEALHYLCKTAGRALFPAPLCATHHELVRQGAEALERLSMEYCETASMAALFENHSEVLLVFESPQLMRMGNTAGRILSPP